jgi:hypothetical protein
MHPIEMLIFALISHVANGHTDFIVIMRSIHNEPLSYNYYLIDADQKK